MLRRNKSLRWIGLASVLLLYPMAVRAEGDALEQFNRSMHEFNQKYYTSSESGANQFFVDTVPEGFRHGINNFFTNLGEPVIAVSSLAEGDVDNAKIATKRFFYNLVWGFGGIYDQASLAGVNPEHHDMGEVICSYGLPDGPFLELPFYGPATVGDLVGSTLPLMAGYVVLGEAFFLYRASSRVASFMDDKGGNSTGTEGSSGGEGGADMSASAPKPAPAPVPAPPKPVAVNDAAQEPSKGDAAKAGDIPYQEEKDRYLATRMTVCRNHLPPSAANSEPAPR